MKEKLNKQYGVTFVELVLVIGILSTLFGISTIGLFRARTATANNSTIEILSSDIRSQQVKAMSGDTEGRSSPDNYGVRIESNRYILFHGNNYLVSDPSNYSIMADQGSEFDSTFANDTIIFASRSGEIVNFVDGQNSLSVTESATGITSTIGLNKYGAIISSD